MVVTTTTDRSIAQISEEAATLIARLDEIGRELLAAQRRDLMRAFTAVGDATAETQLAARIDAALAAWK
jgi:hypothetical protein